MCNDSEGMWKEAVDVLPRQMPVVTEEHRGSNIRDNRCSDRDMNLGPGDTMTNV